MRVSASFVAVLVFAALIAGCGGGSSSDSGGSTASGEKSEKPTGPPLSKKAMIKEGEAICGKIPANYNKKRAALEKELKKKGQKPTKSEENLKAAVPPLFVAVEEFEQLVPPKGDEAEIEAIIKALESAAKGLEEKPESELSGPKSPFNEFQTLTKKYGFEFCSQL